MYWIVEDRSTGTNPRVSMVFKSVPAGMTQSPPWHRGEVRVEPGNEKWMSTFVGLRGELLPLIMPVCMLTFIINVRLSVSGLISLKS